MTPNSSRKAQRAWLDDFVPPRLRALATLATDQFDTVRWIYPGHALGRRRLSSRIRARARQGGRASTTPPRLVAIAWHGRPATDVPAFRRICGRTRAGAAARLVQGQDRPHRHRSLTSTDRHRTPFSTIFAGEGMLPGVVIHAHSLAQLLEGRRAPSVTAWVEFLLALGCAMLGAMLPAFGGGTMTLRIGAGAVFLVALLARRRFALSLRRRDDRPAGADARRWPRRIGPWRRLSGREARRQREFITGAFSRYVSPKIVNALIRDPEQDVARGRAAGHDVLLHRSRQFHDAVGIIGCA